MARFTKNTKIAIVTAALVFGVGGTAFAYWSQLGAGTGGAGTGATAEGVVNQTNTVTDLYPGGTAQALSGDFYNPNTAAVTVGEVSATVTGTDSRAAFPSGTRSPAPRTLRPRSYLRATPRVPGQD